MRTVKSNKPSGERRREAIMETAWALFLEKGFEAVSVDEIIRKSGGSKSTVYDFFGSKEGLFLELATEVSENILKEMVLPDLSGQSPREALTRLGHVIAGQILSTKGIELYRLAVSESRRFPKIGRLFFDAGPGRTRKDLSGYLRKEAEAGRLKIKNPLRAAEHFLSMLLGQDHIAMSVGVAGIPTRSKMKEMVDDTVDAFLTIYGK